MEDIESLKEEIKELIDEIERITGINNSLVRQIKERANASKGQYPKKKHTGYSLVSSVQKEYRYYDGGNKTIQLFETVFQSPYSIDIEYNNVIELIRSDLLEQNDGGLSIIDILGFMYMIECHSYKDLYECKDAKELAKQYQIIYIEKKGDDFLREEDYLRIRRAWNADIKKSFFNLNARMNGKAGYWEMTINHFEPLKSLPPELRFPYKQKKKMDRHNLIKEPPADNEDECDQK